VADISKLVKLIETGENVSAVLEADRLIDQGVSAKEIVNNGLVAALEALRSKCTIENFQLLDVLLSSRAMVEVVDQSIARTLESNMDKLVDDMSGELDKKNKVLVIGTILGDVHDLGKHIVSTMSKLSGVTVINLGKDVPPEKFVETAVREKADIIGVSSLMTVCLPTIKEIRPMAVENGINPLIVAGGAAAQQTDAGHLDVDYVAFDAFDALEFFLKDTTP